jgi:hypothetical protein
MSPIGYAKGVMAAGSEASGPVLVAEWQWEDNDVLTQGKTGDAIDIIIATNVDSFRQTSGSLLGGLTLGIADNVVRLSGTLSQFGFAAVQVDEGNTYTLRASDYGVTVEFGIEIGQETRTFTHRQVGNTLISKQFESYGTPNASWNGLSSQQLDATQNVSASTGGCHSGNQLLSNGGVTSVSINSNNSVYGDPCQGTYKRVFTYYTI